MSALVSVIIPTYNSARYIENAIESVLRQTYQKWELLIIDDASTDNTHALVLPYLADPRLTFFEQPHSGPASGRNRGVALSQGKYLCFLDADDMFLPNKIEVSLKAMTKEVDVVYSALLLIDEKGGEIHTFDFEEELSRENFLAQLLFRNHVIPSATMARRACAEKEPFQEGMIGLEDYELFLRWAQHFTFKYLSTPLIQYRRHSASLSATLTAVEEREKKIVKAYHPVWIKQKIWNTTYSEEEKKILYAKILCKIEAYDDALEALQDVSHPLAYFYQGNVLLVKGEIDRAQTAFLNSIRLNSDNPAVYNNLGVVYVRVGKVAQATELFHQALQLKPEYLDAAQNLRMIKENKDPFPVEKLRVTMRELRKRLMFYTDNLP